MTDTQSLHEQMLNLGKRAQATTNQVANLTLNQRNQILTNIAQTLVKQSDAILAANQLDLDQYGSTLSGPMVKRLTLTKAILAEIADSLYSLVQLADPLAGPYENWTNQAGLKINVVTVPLGVVAMIYEARPNVTVDAASLAIKSGNAVILRGGKEAIHTNRYLVQLMRQILSDLGYNPDIIQLVTDTSHASVDELLHLRSYIDVLIPRGSAAFINHVVTNATVPVIETGAGNTHIFVDESADFDQALSIIENAKTQKPAVCNAAEKLLIHQNIADEFLPLVIERLQTQDQVELRGDVASCELAPNQLTAATAADWDTEYNDLIMGVKIVDDIQEAINWINQHTTHHSETILTEEADHAQLFMREIDAAVVYQNASSRFTDGFQFGFGAEIGISTQKLHARGPMGLKALTTIKYEIFGQGQIRP
ncbi:glutamate-5-semialdehyde dehydrogenase [Convivina praedatoris]|uniref:glutamate-5-semialdehyde dehydrogenase n=1 Tax=Convivina praedatoris TaxID=2880963 RepID=UPI00200E8169|nr:glutamate-5-semialdehyde dehydrogenase [Convivina sp. LMG 32447]CAH1856547.1 Gamma-glutamyl phosphate reductase [Convivina sp. LMG 32447]